MGDVGIGNRSPLMKDIDEFDNVERLMRGHRVDFAVPAVRQQPAIIEPVVVKVSDHKIKHANRAQSDGRMGHHRHSDR